MEDERCIECHAVLDFDPADSLDFPREIGTSGHYLCIGCWRKHDAEEDKYLSGLEADLEQATEGKDFYRSIYGVELTGDEYVCHSNRCKKLVVGDHWDRNPVYLVQSKHDDRLRKCCSLECCLIYAEEETDQREDDE